MAEVLVGAGVAGFDVVNVVLGVDVDVRVFPRAIQYELPVWITAAGSPDTFRYAGQIGASVLTHLLGQSTEDLAHKIEIYREALEEAGYAREHGKVALMLHTFIGESMSQVKDIVRDPMKNYLRHSLNLLTPYDHLNASHQTFQKLLITPCLLLL